MKRFISSVILLLIAVCVWANDGYKIQLTLADLKDTKVYLAFYYNGKMYGIHTANLDFGSIMILHLSPAFTC